MISETGTILALGNGVTNKLHLQMPVSNRSAGPFHCVYCESQLGIDFLMREDVVVIATKHYHQQPQTPPPNQFPSDRLHKSKSLLLPSDFTSFTPAPSPSRRPLQRPFPLTGDVISSADDR
ncbi:hypothetical protein LXL04_019429 [Taraxacum kok-saghyz]